MQMQRERASIPKVWLVIRPFRLVKERRERKE